jgi:polyisoprenoid-binding protein YceI
MSKHKTPIPNLAIGLLVAAAAGATLILAPATSQAASWNVDQAHTEVNFSVKHFFTPVTGSFDDFEIDLTYDADNPENSSVEARIGVASVNTGNERRDNHLRSGDWFEAEKYPHMTFKSTSVQKKGDNQLIARGQLTIKGETREVELPISLLGSQEIPEPMREMFGGSLKVTSFQASAALDRNDYGVGVGSWAATMVVGGEITIEILLEAHLR